VSKAPKLEDIEFAENPEPRCACVLLLDTSSSMSGPRIAALNEGLKLFQETLRQDSLASRRVEVAIVTFDSAVNVVQEFVTVDQFNPPTIGANGNTRMGAGIERALDIVADRKKSYKANGIAYFRPWIFMITDGAPTDPYETAARRVRQEEENKAVAFFAVGVEGADMERLKEISFRAPVLLAQLNFKELFLWLSASMRKISDSKPGDQTGLPPAGWASV
jgi:uncharacterized protein YegL